MAMESYYVATVIEAIVSNLTMRNVLLSGLGALPALFWLLFFLSQEKRQKKEPSSTAILVFAAGIIAAIASLAIQLAIKIYVIAPYSGQIPIAVLIPFALIEESLKFLLVYLAIRKSKFFDEPIDGMLYMITGAMGFAALENILFVIAAANPIGITIFRFIGAVLLHAIASGFIGYYWVKRKLIYGILLASLLHLIFNITALYSDNLIYKLTGNATDIGILLAPIILIPISFFLFRDFDIMKRL